MPTLRARIEKVELNEGTGWYRITTDGSPKVLQTKVAEKGREAAGFSREKVLVEISFTHRERLDEASGRKYDNYYYDSATPAAAEAGGSSDDGIERVGGTQRKLDPKEAWRIALSVGSERAVQTLPLMDENQRDFETQWRLAYEWASRIFLTPPPEPRANGGAASSAGGSSYGPDDSYAPITDEDIPF